MENEELMESGKQEKEMGVKRDNIVEEKGRTWLQYMAAISATLSYFIGGSFTGWTSPALLFLQDEGFPFHITETQGSWVASLFSLGIFFAPIPAAFIADAMGRKPLLVFVSVPYLICWLMIVFTRNVEVLYTSRFVAGITFGITATICPMYVGEIAEDRIRGTIGTIFQVQSNVGTLFEYIVGPYVSYKNLAIISLVFPVLLFLTFIWMPETPYFLVAKNRRDDAEKSLMRLRRKKSPVSVEEEINKIKNFVEVEAKQKGSFRNLFESWKRIKLLCIVVCLFLFQNLTGIIPIISYVGDILNTSGTSMDTDISSIVFASVLLVVSVVCSALVDRTGRRPLLLISIVGCTITLAAEGMYFFLLKKGYFDDTKAYDWMPITFLVCFTVTYSLGMGPLPWAVAGEMFPANVKSLAIALVSMSNGIFAFLAIKLFHALKEGVGYYLSFWFFAGSCIVGTIFIAILIPETKGKSFQQINDEMNTGSSSVPTKESEGKG